MQLEMFFNELSSASVAVDVSAGQAIVRQLVTTMMAATRRGVQRGLHTPRDFLCTLIAPDYSWYQWLADDRVEREVRQYFRSLASRAPFLNNVPDLEAEWLEMDCLCQNSKALGLKAAYLAEGLAISLLSQSEWDTQCIACEIQEVLGEDIDCRNESVHHASKESHVLSHTAWILDRIQTEVSDVNEFWTYIRQSFPLIRFCSAVEEQVAKLPVISFVSVIRGLFHLNAFCVVWQSGAFAPDLIGCNVSPESQSTLQQFGDQREFECPDGQRRVFNWHAKVGKWRIYFDPAAGPGHLFVGYIGKHLDTAKFN